MNGKERPLPFDKNPRARRLLDVLREGPATTFDLLKMQFVHPARQIWELRHWYGHNIETTRLPNRVARYVLVETD